MAGQGSARVTLREIDLSQVKNPQELPQGVPAAVVGPARKGPAFVPQTFANMQQFNETFGSMLENRRESNSNLFGPLALNEWLNNSRAGTYLRVLGVGDGKKSDSNGKVTDSGFVVGSKQVQLATTGPGKVGDNPHAINIADSGAAVDKARTHFLGCFMKDAPGSRFLCDAGIQSETNQASFTKAFQVENIQDGDTVEMFLPKEIINAANPAVRVEKDVTLTFVFNAAHQGAIGDLPKDTIEMQIGGPDPNEDVVVDFLVLLFNLDKTVDQKDVTVPATNGAVRYHELSINFHEVFGGSVADSGPGDTSAINLTLPAGREGNEAFMVQTAVTGGTMIGGPFGNPAALNQKIYFSGADSASPVIRGVLMAPQGVVPALDTNSTLVATFTNSSATDEQIRAAAEAKNFGADAATNLIGYVCGKVGNDQDFKIILNGFTNSDKPAVLDCSFNPDSPAYISKVLNTDPTKIEECGHYL